MIKRRFKEVGRLLSVVFCLVVLIPSFAQALDSGVYRQLSTPFYEPGSSAGSSCGSSVSGDAARLQIMGFFVSKGLSPTQAAGIAGNISAESGYQPERLQGSPSGTATPAETLTDSQLSDPNLGWGLVQWTPPGKMVSTFNPVSNANDLTNQLNFLWNQLDGSGPSAEDSSILSDIKSVGDGDIQNAVLAFQGNQNAGGSYLGFERPSDESASVQSRVDAATQALTAYGNSGSPGAAPTTASDCATSGNPITTSDGSCSANGIVDSGYYSQAQLTQIFGDPGTADSHPAMDANLTTVNFLGHDVTVNKLIAGCLQAVAKDWQANNITYQIKDMGCYRFDSNNGSSNIGLASYHTYGAACDINALNNNYYNTGNNGTQPYDPNCPAAASAVNSGHCYNMPPDVVKIFAAHGFLWGGNYNSIKDYMHFEWHGVNP